MNKYPYIGESIKNGAVVLFYSKNHGSKLWRDNANYQDRWNESLFKNITSEYLRNTKVKIESEEHSEFIQYLIFNVGGNWNSDSKQIKNLCAEWHLIDNELLISNSYQKDCGEDSMRLITLPLPPKESEKRLKVGDEVFTKENNKATIIATHERFAWIEYFEGYLGMGTVNIDELKKPPTPQEKLTDEICNQIGSKEDSYALAKAIINGEIEGLEYKPQ